MDGEVKVSVFCLAYNHEDYIRDCLDGFVMQKTNFKFEVLIHDDASTDKTADIIREYQNAYPDLIKPIYQTENQYSKGIKITKTYLLPAMNGEYIAFCEGDDYWTDPFKLQKQYDYMKEHKECSLCVHRTKIDYIESNRSKIIPDIGSEREYTVSEIIKGHGSLFSTNSFFCRKEVIAEQPECFYAKGFGDYQKMIYASLIGKCVCLYDVMSVYRCGTRGSWTNSVFNVKEKRIAHNKELISLLQRINSYSEEKYCNEINTVIKETEFEILVLQENFSKAKKEPYKDLWKKHKTNELKKKIKGFFRLLYK
ncbi:MAG: glycosyltransferase family 2 protein [Ruminococcaceae bacterium]|nr:glycosyltransferase family 2 protein [Oscillospiraceae bacterium]